MNHIIKKRRVITCSMCCLLITNHIWSQQTYSLEECRSMGLEHNIRIKEASNNIRGAKQLQKEAFTKYFPKVSVSGSSFNANKGLIEMNLAPDANLSMLKNGITGGITATQPIFMGGQIVNNNKLTKVNVEVNKLKMQQSEKEVSLTAEKYYWQVVTLKEKLHTIALIEKFLNRLCNEVETAVNAGTTTRNDLLQVQLKRNDIASKKVNIENGLALSKMVLAQYIGLNETSFEVKSVIQMDNVPLFPEELKRDHQASLLLTPEYRLLRKNIEANKIQSKLAIGKNLPTVAIGAGYMYDNLMDKDHSFGIAFATVSIPLSDWWEGSHAVKRQNINLKNAKIELTDNSELLIIKMQKAWIDLEDAYKQIIIAQKSIEQSTENLRLNEDYYKAGTSSMSDLLDAQSMFQQSKDKYVDVYAQFQIAKLEYLQATGQNPRTMK